MEEFCPCMLFVYLFSALHIDMMYMSALYLHVDRVCISALYFHIDMEYMDTLPHGRSHLRGTGPSSYRTGSKVHNNLGPVHINKSTKFYVAQTWLNSKNNGWMFIFTLKRWHKWYLSPCWLWSEKRVWNELLLFIIGLVWFGYLYIWLEFTRSRLWL